MSDVDPLPHRPPFRFVGRVVERQGEDTLVATHNVGERWCSTLAIECLAQAAGLLARHAGAGMLAAVPRFRLRAPLAPGDLVEIRVRLVRTLGKLMTARGELTVEGKRVATGEVVLAFSDGKPA